MFFNRRIVRHVATLCFLAIFSAFVAPGAAMARGSKSLGWDNVMKLRKGARINIVLFSKKMYTEKLIGLSPADSPLPQNKSRSSFPRKTSRRS